MLSVYLLGFGLFVGFAQFNHRAYWVRFTVGLVFQPSAPYALTSLLPANSAQDGSAPAWFAIALFVAYLAPLAIVARGAFLARAALARSFADPHTQL